MPPNTENRERKRRRTPHDSNGATSNSPSVHPGLPLGQIVPKEGFEPSNQASSSKPPSENERLAAGLSKKERRKKRKRSLASNPDITNHSASAPVTAGQKETVGGEILAKYLALSAPEPSNTSETPITSSPFFPKKRSKSLNPSKSHHLKEGADGSPGVKRDDGKVDILKRRLVQAKEEAAKEKDSLLKRIKELEETLTAKAKEIEEKGKQVAGQEKVHEQLKDAVTCQVCFETLNDPHILSCGHHACKTCLISWFQTPGAYVHELPDDDLLTMNLSYRTKVCHVCRTYIINRPVRMYHLMSILEPLGLDFHLPTTSQANDERANHDPWRNLFPPEKDYYRIKDNNDNVTRCPECLEEIDAGICTGCGIEFSDVGEDWENDFGSDGDMALGGSEDQDTDDDSDGSVVALDGAREALFGFGRQPILGATDDEVRGTADRPRTRNRQRTPPNARPRDRDRRLPAGIAGVLDLMAEDDDVVGETGDYPYDSELEASDLSEDEEAYEDSFIDDDGDETEVEAEGSVVDGDDSEGDSASDGQSGASGELSIDELRRRRTSRYGARDNSHASPEVQIRRSAPSRSRVRQVIESESE